ncbi:hypothetical protein THRCLA_22200 [Thraustotheca clavata]|uniref:Uncharacterized protein n=1 Tax=Thraustotheca clavata TaxID=74557 RepID=A0A1V9ZAI6_9STRA|nr:hypothetical protein THRCLA_22200 [Thraustotheca clavata]
MVASPNYATFMVYLSSAQLSGTLGYFRSILMPSITADLPPLLIIQDLVPMSLQVRNLTLVYQANETMTPEIEAGRNELQTQGINGNVLSVPRHDTSISMLKLCVSHLNQ